MLEEENAEDITENADGVTEEPRAEGEEEEIEECRAPTPLMGPKPVTVSTAVANRLTTPRILVPASLIPVSKNDISHKFWAYMERFTREIKPADVRFLRELKNMYKNPPSPAPYNKRIPAAKTNGHSNGNGLTNGNGNYNERLLKRFLDKTFKIKVEPNENYVKMLDRESDEEMDKALVRQMKQESGVASEEGSSSSTPATNAENNASMGPPLASRKRTASMAPAASSMDSASCLPSTSYASTEQTNDLPSLFEFRPFMGLYHGRGCTAFADEDDEDPTDDIDAEMAKCRRRIDEVGQYLGKSMEDMEKWVALQLQNQQIWTQIKLLDHELLDINLRNKMVVKMPKEDADLVMNLCKDRSRMLNLIVEKNAKAKKMSSVPSQESGLGGKSG